MSQFLLQKSIDDFITLLSLNGITQHSEKWHKVKIYTVGGSQIATLLNKNHFSSVQKLLSEKLGLTKFRSEIQVQWGNLFECLIKKYVEVDNNTNITGSDLYIPGPPGTSYSPDGLGVTLVNHEYIVSRDGEPDVHVGGKTGEKSSKSLVIVPQLKRTLFEFKCPYSRIPDGKIPEHYIPQILYGLDIIPCVDIGLFIQGVFRRCKWEDIGYNPNYDKTLVPESSGRYPLAYGFIGVYFDDNDYQKLLNNENGFEAAKHRDALNNMYSVSNELEIGNSRNNYMSWDLGDVEPAVFKAIMHNVNRGSLRVFYSDTIYTSLQGAPDHDEKAMLYKLRMQIDTFEEICRSNDYLNYGIIPWKLFRVDYNYIEKKPGFLNECLPKVTKFINIIKQCNDPANIGDRINIQKDYLQELADEKSLQPKKASSRRSAPVYRA